MNKLYLEDPYCAEFEAEVTERVDTKVRLSATAFYPGGGGQPADRGYLVVRGKSVPVVEVREDEALEVWHTLGDGERPETAERVGGAIDWPFRLALMRHHGLMHVVNTVARDRFGGIITGVQLGPVRSRIDFKLDGFERDHIAELEALVNEVIARGLAIAGRTIGEAEYRSRPELIRTLKVLPPVVDGEVRIVEIEGFDAQACGATHVHSTREIGRASIVKFENKGKENKRFYWEVAQP